MSPHLLYSGSNGRVNISVKMGALASVVLNIFTFLKTCLLFISIYL